MFVLDPDERNFCGTILLEPGGSRARALGYLNASSAENCIAALPGFKGSVMFVSEADNKLFELVVWASLEAFRAVQGDYRYFDHIPVVAAHAGRGHLCVSYHVFTAGRMAFERGQRWQVSMATVADHDPAEVARALHKQAAHAPDALFQTGDSPTAGRVLVIIGQSPRLSASDFLPNARERWRYDVEVLDATERGSATLPRGVPHRMSPVSSEPEIANA